VAKSNMRSRVHRRVYADYIGVKRYNDAGEVVGETRFVGLFTSDAYTRSVGDVPLIRRKVARVEKAHSDGASRYSARALSNILETFPRDELFQISESDLLRIADGILRLQQRPRTQIFIRRDRFDRYVSIQLYTPRDTYSSSLRSRAHALLAEAYEGRQSAFYPNFSDGPLARVHFIVGLNPGHPEPDEDELELRIRQLSESWEDGLLREAQRAGRKPPPALDGVFTAAYREAFDPAEGLADLDAIAAMDPDERVDVRVYGPEFTYDTATFKIYRRDQSLDLSDVVPVLENMGLRVRSETAFKLTAPLGEGDIWIHNVVMDKPSGEGRLTAAFEDAFKAVWTGRTENDGFNRLVVRLGVDWRRAALLRALCRYRLQTGLDPSEAVQVSTLAQNANITRSILDLFAIRFDPAAGEDLDARRQASEPVIADIETALDSVASLDSDRVLRRLSRLVGAIQRTNFYQLTEDGDTPRHIAVKIASRELEAVPEPKPFREIFVWSPDVEGVHLRFGPVARGGLRWSDRRDDFRTEVLGLVKAQQVKNAVIVPVGSKGGFYPKKLPEGGSREAVMEAGVAAYKTFISSMIEITDTMVDGVPKRPEDCVAWDGDDPYLVVAADKGTATFSDIANGISEDHDFWLGDAFASGGSVGYDHKK
ncbi:MAG: NAD-glutamate dehydrogenase domain-containing protein, partial [Pseudomonadota bacterium]